VVDKISPSTVNQTISTYKILQEDVLEKKWKPMKIKRPRRNQKLPVVLSLEEVERLISSTFESNHGEEFLSKSQLCPEQIKAFNAIITCRTSFLGGHASRCDNCGYTQQAYNSCCNRHCLYPVTNY